ncbi:hypothetical protein KIN20_035923 [Parelaphostrongylus tenuis]|uniref:Uncharacterized protein n=1 Tax=Parelaphostrongylus tenuis TaxID=148309 RepID=A0AAD5RC62_PARTN|nr:hypothetical protein KIN20_035923 [Parelaphostrongylus tenuis]
MGCGVMPADACRGVLDVQLCCLTTLPIVMAYSTAPYLGVHVPGIAADMGTPQAFVTRLVMQARTTNITMSKWSRTMWQGVVNGPLQMLTSGPLGSHFFAAPADVEGN